jgi:hypothetical protein
MSLLTKIQSHLSPLSPTFDTQLFLTQLYEPSKIYKFDDLMTALPIVAEGIAGVQFYLGEEGDEGGWEYGLVVRFVLVGWDSSTDSSADF